MIKNVIFFKFYILKDESYFFLKLFLLKMLFEQRFVMILKLQLIVSFLRGVFVEDLLFFFLIMLYLFFSFFFIDMYLCFIQA